MSEFKSNSKLKNYDILIYLNTFDFIYYLPIINYDKINDLNLIANLNTSMNKSYT